MNIIVGIIKKYFFKEKFNYLSIVNILIVIL